MEAINIIIDERKPEIGINFIEIENDARKSISIGERILDRGLTKIRITIYDIEKAKNK